MPLNAQTLKQGLASRWMVADGGSHPSSPAESADRFAAVVSQWFATAVAAGAPCQTAQVRRPQLSMQALGAFGAQNPQASGQLLGLAVAAYIAGQVFGPGVASFPPGVSLAQSALSLVFADLESAVDARAERIAQALTALAKTTPVIVSPAGTPVPIL